MFEGLVFQRFVCACDGAFKDYVWPTHPMYI